MDRPAIVPWIPQDTHICGHGMLIRTGIAEWTCYECRAVFRHTWLKQAGHSHVEIRQPAEQTTSLS